MPEYTIGSVRVDFPFEAYDCQVEYMRKVVKALEGKSNALLESPTGTGKTLCLLCATLGWLESKKAKEAELDKADEGTSEEARLFLQGRRESRTIVYSSRTHSQLAKVIKELKATSYRPRTCILGSRQQMCIHPTISKMQGNPQNQACRSLVAKQGCKAHNMVTEWMAANKQAATQLLDIEDLVKIGHNGGGCPFYISRELQTDAELVILPYNYLVDPKIRKSMTNLDWARCVLIFDEAHNLERVCTDAASFDLTSVRLSQCMAEVQSAIEYKLQSGANSSEAIHQDVETEIESFRVTKTILSNLEKAIAGHAFPASGEGVTFPGDYIFQLLAKAEITAENYELFLEQLLVVTQALEERDEDKGTGSRRSTYSIPSLSDAIKIVQRSMGKLSEDDPPMFEGYRVHISDGRKESAKFKSAAGTNFKRMPTLSYWCFLPGIAMRELQNLGVESIIVTSGTLAPLASFSHELQLPFKESIENPHVIDPSQVWLGIVPVGPSNVRLNSSYKTRDLRDYKNDLGNAIANFSRVIPDGLLVFFPSFVVMNKCVEAWQSPLSSGGAAGSIWDHITRYKQPIIEPRESKLFAHAAEDFKAKLDDPSYSGAIFFGVCRGKASEGLDFSDKAGRGVIVTGIPFAMKTDPQVRIKKDVLDEDCRKNSRSTEGRTKLTGDQWYRQQASRAVNQALGRVIRHRHDYGAIILLDERFGNASAMADLSKWLRPHARNFQTFGSAAGALTHFFRKRRSVIQVSAEGVGGGARAGAAKEEGGFAALNVPGVGLGNVVGSDDAPRRPAAVGIDVRGLSAFASKLAGSAGKSEKSRPGFGQQLSDMLAMTKKRKLEGRSLAGTSSRVASNKAPPPQNQAKEALKGKAKVTSKANVPAMKVMHLAKNLYSKEDYKKFILTLKSYKEKRITIQEFTRTLKESMSYDQTDLLRALEHFVVTTDVAEYRKLIVEQK
ncbi:DNA repair helicase [Chloropicon primus]|uniref:Regulator of telomere elongation helicase 1 homolog n=1 Tax=Chloropicon primus TaxID=1764295 RepID=A0A5B8MSP0_9CHLO|nr:DNA repair helicase [Chloropicon primus]UPR01638.1 DNA repair helicase [Chloropicon primus]|mmetsp:Transcript_3886/g.11234  ORF Transcript_3886/g.11234 Transcript_3886/m.11234 type:complete len:953 (+) Transcript_3886:238-3096(+)|eukprot:QDZ22420.1 DNA repair helicase [Chloropicon primus]